MMKNLLGIASLTGAEIQTLLDRADEWRNRDNQPGAASRPLAGRTVVNLFLEPSTRTRVSFEMAATRLGANVVNVAGSSSSMVKGEGLSDTLETVAAMEPDAIVLRHRAAGAALYASSRVPCALINAGDGCHEHPTQALLDALTVRRARQGIEGLHVALLGDVRHSRVARSAMHIFTRLGARVVLGGPRTLVPREMASLGAEVAPSPAAAVEGADVVVALRVQRERMHGAFFPNTREYARWFGLTPGLLATAAPGAIVLHPGPMNRGVEIAGDVADGPASHINEQVTNGVSVRMAALERALQQGEAAV